MVIPGGYLVTSESLMTKGYHRGALAPRNAPGRGCQNGTNTGNGARRVPVGDPGGVTGAACPSCYLVGAVRAPLGAWWAFSAIDLVPSTPREKK